MGSIQLVRAFLLCFGLFVRFSHAQFAADSLQYEEVMGQQQELLDAQLESHPDVEPVVYPERTLIDVDFYDFVEPPATDYVIDMIIDPCNGLDADCCMNTYGVPEYARYVGTSTLASPSEVLNNIELVSRRGDVMEADESRLVDDESFIDETCLGEDTDPSHCGGFRKGLRRSSLIPPCLDNNFTVDASLNCTNPLNTSDEHPYCLQVAYTSTAFIFQCGNEFADDPSCGTYLEVHRNSGSPYDGQDFIINERKIEKRSTSGYYTTTVPMLYGNASNKILCNYEEFVLREGLMAKVSTDAPSCCCPPTAYQTSDNGVLGAYFCPINGFISGPFATRQETLAEFMSQETVIKENKRRCPHLDGEDRMYCSYFDETFNRYYSAPCDEVTKTTSGNREYYSSDDLQGTYTDGVCPYFSNCAMTYKSTCQEEDYHLSFGNLEGKITSIPTSETDTQIGLSFNDGRTSYFFESRFLSLVKKPHNYEVWWVQRTKTKRIVQARKPFRVSSPECTFDIINDRYFPYKVVET